LLGALDHVHTRGVDAAELLLVERPVLVLERVGVAAAAAGVGGAAGGEQQQQFHVFGIEPQRWRGQPAR